MAQEEMKAAIAALGLSMTVEFVPWSKSRSFTAGAKVNKRSLNWKVTVWKARPDVNGPSTEPPGGVKQSILTADYMAGLAYCPSYQQNARWTIAYTESIEHETETGTKSRDGATFRFKGEPILPDLGDVLHSLVLDSDVIDHPTFESWASELDMDPDSRKAEAMYRTCLELTLKLRAGLGEEGLATLRAACQDY